MSLQFPPAGIAWEQQATDFIDGLVDFDIAYLEVQVAIEHLIHAGLHDEITASFDLDDRTLHWHRMPPLGPGLVSIDVFTTVEQSGLIRVLYLRFSHAI